MMKKRLWLFLMEMMNNMGWKLCACLTALAMTVLVSTTVLAAEKRPIITTQPKSVTVTTGSTASFKVTASGKGLKYQWYYMKPNTTKWIASKNSSGKTAVYQIVVKTSHNGYKYKCVVTNAAGKASSQIAKLTVRNHPITEFGSGGILVSNGREYVSDTRARSAMYPLETLEITWNSSSRFRYMVIYYDANYNVVRSTGFRKTSMTIQEGKAIGAKYFRVMLKPVDVDYRFKASFTLSEKAGRIQSSKSELKVVHDKVSSKGVKTMLKRADQLLNLPMETTNTLPFQKGDLPAGTKKVGVIYSSSRTDNLYISQCISLDTYMTALKNPNSYIYTRTHKGPNSKTYYGAVCSSFISYVYDLDCVYTTKSLAFNSNFEKAKYQDVEHLRIGDMFLSPGKHVMVVYDIIRDAKGRPVSIYFAHQATPTTCVYGTTPSDVAKELTNYGYQIYKFKNWDKLTYEESQWVSVGSEAKKNPVWNRYLGPRRGDKANWPLGETVEIDILQKGDYTTAQLYRGSKLLDETDIAGTKLLSYSNLETGSYRVCLANGEKRSSCCYFKVVSSEVSAVNLGGGRVKIRFASEMGTPAWYAWCYTAGKDYKGTAMAASLTEKNAENGYVVSGFEAGDWFFRVEFKNEYGVFSSELVRVMISE